MFLDVIYGAIAVHMLGYLPPVRDMSWAGKPLGLLGALIADGRDVWRVVMGLGITSISWYLSARRLCQLRATDFIHVTIVLFQTGFLCFFVYFAICDPTLTGGPSSRALQCGAFALASLSGHLAWRYACWRQLVDAATPLWQLEGIGRRWRTEAATAILNTPLSWVGPISWTVGWLIIPLVITTGLPWFLRAARRSDEDR